jgi:hypothetical protein
MVMVAVMTVMYWNVSTSHQRISLSAQQAMEFFLIIFSSENRPHGLETDFNLSGTTVGK